MVYNYTTISIPLGSEVEGTGDLGLIMHCQETVTVSGVIRVDGLFGKTGENSAGQDPTNAPGGEGGEAGPGGWKGGDGAMTTIGLPETSTGFPESDPARPLAVARAVTAVTRIRATAIRTKSSGAKAVAAVQTARPLQTPTMPGRSRP